MGLKREKGKGILKEDVVEFEGAIYNFPKKRKSEGVIIRELNDLDQEAKGQNMHDLKRRRNDQGGDMARFGQSWEDPRKIEDWMEELNCDINVLLVDNIDELVGESGTDTRMEEEELEV
uniref:Uncharacterized protein n=1 Tax=Nelumbo nucifera TaxID=4432 RepID=A0A822XQG5_NELNU|nr:TPA_asm: hypothetical protein HUJ06_023386 [Nelumbo nucifera]